MGVKTTSKTLVWFVVLLVLALFAGGTVYVVGWDGICNFFRGYVKAN